MIFLHKVTNKYSRENNKEVVVIIIQWNKAMHTITPKCLFLSWWLRVQIQFVFKYRARDIESLISKVINPEDSKLKSVNL